MRSFCEIRWPYRLGDRFRPKFHATMIENSEELGSIDRHNSTLMLLLSIEQRLLPIRECQMDWFRSKNSLSRQEVSGQRTQSLWCTYIQSVRWWRWNSTRDRLESKPAWAHRWSSNYTNWRTQLVLEISELIVSSPSFRWTKQGEGSLMQDSFLNISSIILYYMAICLMLCVH